MAEYMRGQQRFNVLPCIVLLHGHELCALSDVRLAAAAYGCLHSFSPGLAADWFSFLPEQTHAVVYVACLPDASYPGRCQCVFAGGVFEQRRKKERTRIFLA